MLVIIALVSIVIALSAGRLYRMFFYSDEQLKNIYEQWKLCVASHARTHNDALLLTALIAVESGGIKTAKSSCDARGLMQITPIVIEEYQKQTGSLTITHDDMYNPDLNVNVGYWYLRRLISHYSLSVYDALRAYNAGIGSIAKSKESGSLYAARVLAYAQRLASIT